MGIALLSLECLLAPLQSLRSWVARASQVRHPSPWVPPAAVHSAVARRAPRTVLPGSCRDRPRRPLRVVRVVEAFPAPSGAGRMVISGRMADVCAELDRLAALEAAAG